MTGGAHAFKLRVVTLSHPPQATDFSIADQLRADLRRLDRGESPRTIAAGWVDQIRALRDEAATAGDSECVTICNRALNGSPFVTRRAALRIVLNVLANARGNQGAA